MHSRALLITRSAINYCVRCAIHIVIHFVVSRDVASRGTAASADHPIWGLYIAKSDGFLTIKDEDIVGMCARVLARTRNWLIATLAHWHLDLATGCARGRRIYSEMVRSDN